MNTLYFDHIPLHFSQLLPDLVLKHPTWCRLFFNDLPRLTFHAHILTSVWPSINFAYPPVSAP